MPDYQHRHRETCPCVSGATAIDKPAAALAAWLALAAAALGGCATTEELCSQHARHIRETRIVTHYELNPQSGAHLTRQALPKGTVVAVRSYNLSVDPDSLQPCRDTRIRKSIVVQRRAGPRAVIKESREIYAQDGTLIASVSETVSDQITASGEYLADIPLPIPRKAPPGRYRIVGKLTLERAGDRRSILLGRSEASFRVEPLQ